MQIITPLTDAELDELLQATSRTFALSIPLLPPVERREVGLAYLVFRIADTLEDAELYVRDQRIDALEMFIGCLADHDHKVWCDFAAACDRSPPSDVAAYNELLIQTPRVLRSLHDCEPETIRVVAFDASRSAEGMMATLEAGGSRGNVEFDSIDQLRQYCYYVAGIVGEMLTRLFARRLAPGAIDELMPLAREFGEGLQLVNILKDAGNDALQGRSYLPTSVDRSEVFALAYRDLQSARQYVATLKNHNAPTGYIQFSQLPIELAAAALGRLAEQGVGAKINRQEVAAILSRVASMAGALVDSDR